MKPGQSGSISIPRSAFRFEFMFYDICSLFCGRPFCLRSLSDRNPTNSWRTRKR